MALKLAQDSFISENQSRFTKATVILIAVFGVLMGRIWFLQIHQGKKWRRFSEANRLEIKRIPALRGKLLDRDGRVIVKSRPAFHLAVVPAQLKGGLDDFFALFQTHFDWDEADKERFKRRLQKGNRHDPVILVRDLKHADLAFVTARMFRAPSVRILEGHLRSYPEERSFAHLVGYLGEIGPKQLEKLNANLEQNFYRQGEVYGVGGLEKLFEHDLRGVHGSRAVIEDVWGRELGEELSKEVLPDFAPQPAEPGQDVRLTVDLKIQEAMEKAFGDRNGAAVALDPRNGEVLAWLSMPDYDPEEFVDGVSSAYWNEVRDDPDKPLLNRVIQGLFPPASPFKVVTAWAALKNEATDGNERIFCPGHYRIGREVKSCWKKSGHGWVDLRKALAVSCDVFFYEMSQRLGIEKIAEAARALGLGSKPESGMPAERAGLVPDAAWKKKRVGRPWVKGETASVAIGQGAVLASPLQMALVYGAFLNGGKVIRPKLSLASEPKPDVRKTANIQEPHRRMILSGLEDVVGVWYGTAYWYARSKKLRIGGKTGTAQVVGKRSKIKVEDHAWFIGYAPVEDPKIVVAAIVEHGGHGSSGAAPIVKAVIEAFWEGK